MKKLLFPILIGVLSLVLTSSASIKNHTDLATGSNLSQAEADLMVRTHNKWRSEVGVVNVKWSVEVARSAQKWADELGRRGCAMKHSSDRKYGENIFWSSGMNPTAEDVTNDWAAEIKFYKKGTKISYSNYSNFGHYTQMVWSSTTEIGCGRAKCAHGKEVWVCQYNPAGNYIGEKPYDETVQINKVKMTIQIKTMKRFW